MRQCSCASMCSGGSSGPSCSNVLTLPDLELAERIGEFWGYPRAGCARSIFGTLETAHLGVDPYRHETGGFSTWNS